KLRPDWRPSPDEIAWVRERYVASDTQIAGQAERFSNFHRGRGSQMADWAAAWRTWWLNGYHKIPARTAAPAPLFETKLKDERQLRYERELKELQDGAL